MNRTAVKSLNFLPKRISILSLHLIASICSYGPVGYTYSNHMRNNWKVTTCFKALKSCIINAYFRFLEDPNIVHPFLKNKPNWLLKTNILWSADRAADRAEQTEHEQQSMSSRAADRAAAAEQQQQQQQQRQQQQRQHTQHQQHGRAAADINKNIASHKFMALHKFTKVKQEDFEYREHEVLFGNLFSSLI